MYSTNSFKNTMLFIIGALIFGYSDLIPEVAFVLFGITLMGIAIEKTIKNG